MKTNKLKKLIVVISIIICLGVFETIGVIPYIVARTTTSIYVASHYSSMSLKFESAGYVKFFGDYGVTYKDKNGNIVGFRLAPAKFPTGITYDSIKGNC